MKILECIRKQFTIFYLLHWAEYYFRDAEFEWQTPFQYPKIVNFIMLLHTFDFLFPTKKLHTLWITSHSTVTTNKLFNIPTLGKNVFILLTNNWCAKISVSGVFSSWCSLFFMQKCMSLSSLFQSLTKKLNLQKQKN